MGNLLMSCPEMGNFCKKVCTNTDPSHTNISSISWGTFKDGSPDTLFDAPTYIKGSDVFFMANFEKTESIFRQLSVLYALPHYGAKSLTVFLPYFPTATMERVDVYGQIATAKTLMRMLNAIPACHGSGPARLVIYDIHSLAVQHFHMDGIIIELKSAIPLLFKRLVASSFASHSYVFAFPDEGAKKRFHTFFHDPCIICTKDENRKVTIKEGYKLASNADVIIIDDMCRDGNTLINCKDTLLKAGASSVSAYVTHGVFPKDSWMKFQDGSFKKFWVTDSCSMGQMMGDEKTDPDLREPFELISLASDIASDING